MAQSGCSKPSYTTPKGLQFSLYCDQDPTNIADTDGAGATSVEDCMNKCSEHPMQPCGGASFDSNTFKCFFKNSTVTAADAVPRKGWTVGIANATQFKPAPINCVNNGKTRETKNGLDFIVYCDQNLLNFDMCPDTNPGCRAHSDTMGECVEYCSTMHPLCTGVVWDPVMNNGYLNCYPKNATAQVFDDNRGPDTIPGIRAAKALLVAPTEDCRSSSSADGTVLASNKETIKLSCDEDRPGNNITSQHFDSLGKCIDACTTYTNLKVTCLGAVFDANMIDGYENCYLKSAIGAPTPNRLGFSFALRNETVTGKNPSTPVGSPTPSSTPEATAGKASMAWVAAPVIGGIVAIAFIIAGVWWCRRRTARKAALGGYEMDSQETQGMVAPDINPSQHPVPLWHKAELDSAKPSPKYELAESPLRPPTIHEMDTMPTEGVKTQNRV